MDVCTSEWQEGCLSCSPSSGYWHLSPSVFHLPAPRLSQTHTFTLSHAYTHCSAFAESPTSKASLPLSCLITQTVCRSTPSSAAQRDRTERGKWKGMGRQRGWFIHSGGLICSERCCFGSKNFPSDTCPIDTLKRLPAQQKWWDNSPRLQIGRWERDVKEERAVEVAPPAENSRYHLQPLSGLFLSIFIHFPLIIVNVAHRCHGRRYLHKCHSPSSLSSPLSPLLISMCRDLM